jgi:hypothetical protein
MTLIIENRESGGEKRIMNLLEGIRKDGTVEDTPYETFFRVLTQIETADGYLRLRADDGGVDIEIRLPYQILENMGWTRSADAAEGCCDIHSQFEALLTASDSDAAPAVSP